MSTPNPRTTEVRAPGEASGAVEAGGRAAMTGPELDRARKAYKGAIEAARAWRAFSDNPRQHDTTYWTLFATLFAEPGMNRTRLIDRIMDGAGVSRSTAERSIREARESGLITYEQAGAEVLLDLSPRMFKHCADYFRDWMDRDKLSRNFGYDDDYVG